MKCILQNIFPNGDLISLLVIIRLTVNILFLHTNNRINSMDINKKQSADRVTSCNSDLHKWLFIHFKMHDTMNILIKFIEIFIVLTR